MGCGASTKQEESGVKLQDNEAPSAEERPPRENACKEDGERGEEFGHPADVENACKEDGERGEEYGYHERGGGNCVLWCDSDVRVERTAGILKAAGLEVRAFCDPEELLQEYGERGGAVLGILSSMMESGGRKERGAMNAFGLFAAVTQQANDLGVCRPICGVISASGDEDAAYLAGADFFARADRTMAQDCMLKKINWVQDRESERCVLWCDSNASGVEQFARPIFEAKGFKFMSFSGIEEMMEAVPWGSCVAVISSTMESGGRKENGLLNGFDGFASIRAHLVSSAVRPVFALVSGSSSAQTCFRHGVDIASCKDNAAQQARHEDARLWNITAADVLRTLEDRGAAPPSFPTGLAGGLSSSLFAPGGKLSAGFPAYWDAKGGNISEMVPVHDTRLTEALQVALRSTFVRGSDGVTARSTRDRPAGEKPKDFTLAQAYRIEDAALWRRYAAFRAGVGVCEAFEQVAGPGGCPKTASVSGLPETASEANETYLFHGTSPDAANAIINSGFRIDLAGSFAGCAFGKGAYLAEASTKADEYARPGTGLFSSMYAMLLCRVTLGQVARVQEFYHSSESTRKVVDGIIATGSHHSLLGDREAAVGTYREFIVFKREQIYPEFVLLYHRDCE